MTIRGMALLACLTALVGPSGHLFAQGIDLWSVRRLVEEQERLGRTLAVQDVYKLIYQGSFGVDHLLADTAAARQYLLDELAGLDSAWSGEPLVERISTDGSVVRVNLRPFRHRGLCAESLFQVMVRSGTGSAPDTVMFLNLWNIVTPLVRDGIIAGAEGDMERLDDMVRRGDIHPLHHSPQYTGEYAPAYRVVRKTVFDRVFASVLSGKGGPASPEESRK